MMVLTMPEAFSPGDSGGCRINEINHWISWSADGAIIALNADDRRAVLEVGPPDPLGLRNIYCGDAPLQRWRITYRETGAASIVVEAESAEAAQAKFAAGDATVHEWIDTWKNEGGGYEIVEVVHAGN